MARLASCFSLLVFIFGILSLFFIPETTFEEYPPLLQGHLLGKKIISDVTAKIAKVGIHLASRFSLPTENGEIKLPDGILSHPVEIRRDEQGVPHIIAENTLDMLVAHGFVQAQDRLWQLEFSRMLSQGRLSELFGNMAIPMDELIRTVGFARIGRNDVNELTVQEKQMLESFVKGINALLAHPSFFRPVEFQIFNHVPKNFSVEDVLIYLRFFSWQISKGWDSEVVRSLITNKVGADHAAHVDNFYTPDSYATHLVTPFEERDLEHLFEKTDLPPAEEGGGSNAWVISGEKTKSGKPLLANDPHLPLTNPSIWYPSHLVVEKEDINLFGFGTPLVPSIILGTNSYVSWGVTVARFDIEDLFMERLKKEGEKIFYQFKDEWLPVKVHEELIRVKGGGKPSIYKVLETHHGPIVSDVFGLGHHKDAALSSTVLKSKSPIRAITKLMKVRNWDDMLEVAETFETPALNCVFADREGNIGYLTTGAVPIRANNGSGDLPNEGWTGEHEWVGFIPYSDMPRAKNPKKGFIVSANQKLVSDDQYAEKLGKSFASAWRAKWATQMIEKQQEKIDVDFLKKLHQDVHSLAAIELKKRILRHTKSEDTEIQECLKYFEEWDGNMDVNSVPATLYQVFKRKLFHNIFEPALGYNLTMILAGSGFRPLLKIANEFQGFDIDILLRVVDDETSWWVNNVGGVRKVMEKSMRETIDWCKENISPISSEWKWISLHKTSFVHALGRKFPSVFNIGPVEVGGDSETLAMSSMIAHTGFETTGWAVSLRYILDMDQPDTMNYVTPPGVSGIFSSKHFSDQVDHWVKGDYFKIFGNYKKNKVESKLSLK